MEYIHSSRYRAPEVLLRARRYGPPVDMFAMGCILAELITLRPLLPGSSEVCTLHPPHMLWWCFSLCAHLSWAAFWSELITQRPLLSGCSGVTVLPSWLCRGIVSSPSNRTVCIFFCNDHVPIHRQDCAVQTDYLQKANAKMGPPRLVRAES